MRFAAIRLHYLIAYAIIGAYMPYLPVFLGRDLGMPDWQIGWVAGMYGMAVVFSPPLVTYLADRRLSGRALIGLAYALTAAALLTLAFARAFLPVLLISMFFSTVYTPIFALLDGLVFSASATARAAGRPVPPYDRVRVWGSFGFMIPAFALFIALTAGAASGRAAIFAAAIAAALGAVCIPLLPRIAPNPPVPLNISVRPVPKDSSSKPVPSDSLAALLLPADATAWDVLLHPSTRPFIFALGLLFASIAVFYGFYPRLVLAAGVDPAWVGLVMNLGVLSELPFMLAAGPLLRRFSLRHLVLFGGACLALRMGLLASVADPRLIIASQVLHGPVVIAIYLIPPMYINLRAPAAVRNGVQGLYAMICLGVARLLGSVAGGYAAGLGLVWAFALGAALALIALIWLYLRFFDPAADEALRAPVSRT